MATINYTDWETGDDIQLPAKWEICPVCEGEGKESAYLGSWTGSEWAEEDPDFQEDYMRGGYDRRCEQCNGSGKIKDIDWDSIEANNPELYAELTEQEDARASYEYEVAAERRMGA